MRLRPITAFGLVLCAILLSSPPAGAGAVLEAVKARGMLRCGVSEGIAGFSQQDSSGRWQGLDADFCRAVAAAVVGDAEKVEFVPLRASTRFPALQAKKVDLLARNTTWTLTREAVLKVQFPAIIYYDAQGFLVPAESGIREVGGLDGATICVERGTHHRRNLQRYAAQAGLSFIPLVAESAQEVAAAFFEGRCAAYSADTSQLAAARTELPGGADQFVILEERIAEEPLAPVVWGGDPEWTTVVRWTLFGLVLAEKHGVTQANVEALAVAASGPVSGLFQEVKDQIGEALGLDPSWMVRAIRAVGNYGELFERHVGGESPLKLERGLNRLWGEGGLLYAPPID
ncbi:MAG: amino acid ABC transporter substrate-binding protein [Rhodospirillales bacterium]|nr:MAG: amino acid ABC transporter substrate-binding protein [Rhodospirillales bacterium]